MSNNENIMTKVVVGKTVSRLSVVLIPVFCLALSWCGFQVLVWILQTKGLPLGDVASWVLFGSGVCCGVAGAIGISHLFFLLRRLEKEPVFTARNVRALGILTWCACVFLVAGVVDAFLVGCLFLAAIGVVAGIIGFLVWVVREIFVKAVELHNDAAILSHEGAVPQV